MKNETLPWGAFIAALLLTGCAGRAPDLPQIVKAEDNQLTCEQLTAEIHANNDRVKSLAREEGWKVAQNVAAGVGGIIVPVLWFGMDFQDAAGKEAQALSQRNKYLAGMAGRKCGDSRTIS